MGIIVGNRSSLVKPKANDGMPLTFVHRSFTEYFASKELVRMIEEDTLRDTLLLVGMRNTTSADHLPPLYQFMHRFKRSTTFRSDINQVVEFAYDVLDKQRQQGLKSVLADESNLTISKNRDYLNDAIERQELTPHEIMLDIDFKDTAHFCSVKECKYKTSPSEIGNVDSRINQACFCGHQSLLQCEQLETNSFEDTLLHAKLEKLSIQKVKWQMRQLLRVTKKVLYIVVDIDNYNEESSIKLNQFAERLNDAIVRERYESDPQFDEMNLEQKRRNRVNEKEVHLYLFCSRRNTVSLNFQYWSLLENIVLLSINGINITTDEVKKMMKYTDRENSRAAFQLELTRNGFSEKEYLNISMFIEENKDVLKHSPLDLKFDPESSLSYSTVKGCLELIWQELNYHDMLIAHSYNTTNINLTKADNLQDVCEMITSKVINSIKNNVIDQLIRIIMNRCSLTDQSIVEINKMIESIINVSSEHKVKINTLQLNLFHNNFSYTGERMLHLHALKFKYRLIL